MVFVETVLHDFYVHLMIGDKNGWHWTIEHGELLLDGWMLMIRSLRRG